METVQYAWLIWSLLLLAVWAVVYVSLASKESKKEMLVVSLWTSLLGATEPLFVPEYWSPPSLFDLALRTGFDIESFLFAFGIGGLAAVIYEKMHPVAHRRMPPARIRGSRHTYHTAALLSAPVLFILLLLYSDLNPIYAASLALLAGGIFSWYCRPDLKRKMITGSLAFLALYVAYFSTLNLAYPGYVEAVWNLDAVSGVLVAGIPIEELLFALSFGFLWSSIYEHATWRTIKRANTT